MPRSNRMRFVVIDTSYDGTVTVYGPWYEEARATKVENQLLGLGRDAHLTILSTWPGIRAFG